MGSFSFKIDSNAKNVLQRTHQATSSNARVGTNTVEDPTESPAL